MGKQDRYGLAVAAWLALTGAAFAQNAPLEGIRESTDPQKVAEVEQRAREIMDRHQQQASGESGTSATRSSREAAPNKYREPGRDRMNRGHRPGKMQGESDGTSQR